MTKHNCKAVYYMCGLCDCVSGDACCRSCVTECDNPCDFYNDAEGCNEQTKHTVKCEPS